MNKADIEMTFNILVVCELQVPNSVNYLTDTTSLLFLLQK